MKTLKGKMKGELTSCASAMLKVFLHHYLRSQTINKPVNNNARKTDLSGK